MKTDVLVILAVALTIVAAGAILINPGLVLPEPPESDVDDFAKWESETRQMLILVIGGLASFATILVGLVKLVQMSAEKRAKEQLERDKRLDIGRPGLTLLLRSWVRTTPPCA
ncbi:hypothetical protein FDP08_12180 [Marinobacter panjinensis]|uniref:Uncharacterized protein n=1 Tax=Marinobacter panjinensis TaxID=2576384 RepID=A0A4U6R5F2_9GAMM|nr:hypothetical protein [Marinobacter panjinensis]MCR8914369.1 hypothetical protein [Marinobacter panjinensis]TKV68793.1 hypothetical protein FDP08_12180 [Marinobacter panjinensis]